MRQHTLIFDAELRPEDIERYQECAGVIGLSAYQNVLNVYFVNAPSRHELLSLAEAVAEQLENGVHLLAEDLIGED